MKSFKRAFLTGCDKSNEWMIPWFVSNYMEHNDIPLLFANFGVSSEFLDYAHETFNEILDLSEKTEEKGWFKKPRAMIMASKKCDYTCWIDTDFQIIDEIQTVFNYVEEGRLAMVEDKPWTKRRSLSIPWYNSGIVAFKDCPQILEKWAERVKQNPIVGDQEVLHSMMDSPLTQRIYISDVPNEYNWLRLQLEHDNQDSKRKKAIHWTGQKGKERIKNMVRKWEK